MSSELLVYVVDTTEVGEIPTNLEEFKTLAKELNTVYSLKNFEEAFNNGEVSAFVDVIRIAGSDIP